MIIEPKLLKGFRDSLPEKEMVRKAIISTLEKTFSTYGFRPIDTPVLEYTEVLLGKGGGDTDKQMYRFRDNGNRDVAMRFDLTVPFARYMAAHLNELALPFKRFHIGKVWRGENTQRGRYREFMQCDFDIVGADNTSSDFEILSMMYGSFRAMGVENVEIRISHRGIFNNFLDRLNVRPYAVEIMRTVDKISKIGETEVKKLLTEIAGADAADRIIDYITPAGDFLSTLDKIAGLSGGDSEHSIRMKEIHDCMTASGIEEMFVLDPSITRGLDYYTGLVYETFLKDIPGLGSVCSGGRYNDLASLYTKTHLPGVGASIGLDRLIAGLEELGVTEKRTGSSDVMIMNLEDSSVPQNHRIAAQIRAAGISCEVFLDNKKVGNQFSYADRNGIPFVLFCGGEEQKAGTVSLRNTSTRENHSMIKVEEACRIIRDTLVL